MSSPTRTRLSREGLPPVPGSLLPTTASPSAYPASSSRNGHTTRYSRHSEDFAGRPSDATYIPHSEGNGSPDRTPLNRFAQAGAMEKATPTKQRKYVGSDPYGPRPTFKEWWIMYWHDFLCLLVQAGISLGLLIWSPLPTHKYFAVVTHPTSLLQSTTNTSLPISTELVNPELAHPKRSQYIPISADAILALGVPMLIITLMQIRVRSFWDMNNAFWGVIYSVMTACFLQIVIKLVYAGLRPHFYTVCQPTPSGPGEGWGGLYYTTAVCSQTDAKLLANAMQSFPSGHSAAAWAGLWYGTLYLNAKLKVFSNTHPSYFSLLAFFFQPLLATCIVGTLLLDMSHNWYDVLAGSLLGVAVAFGAYRTTFCAVWDWRWNHVPCPRVLGSRGEVKERMGRWVEDGRDGGSVVGRGREWDRCVGVRYGGWGRVD